MEGFEGHAGAATEEPSAVQVPAKEEARSAIDPLTAAKRRRTTTSGSGGLAPTTSTDSACGAGGTLPPTTTKGPQAFGLEDKPQTSGLAANGGSAPSPPSPHPEPTSDVSDGEICTKCGHGVDSQECCGGGKTKVPNRGGEECAAKRMRILVKSTGCQTCGGPCNHRYTHCPNGYEQDEQEHKDELEELNVTGGNWRHRKARNEAIRNAAVRQREIPTMENAQTEAQKKMAAMAAKFRK